MDKIKVLVVAPMERPKVVEVEHTLEKLQEIVGGYISASYPFENDNVAVVCDDEGAFKYPLNRWIDSSRAWFGTFFVCGLTEDDFGSLSDEQVSRYSKLFKYPEFFMKNADTGAILQVKVGAKAPPRVIVR